MTGPASIDRLRAIADRMRARDDPDVAWFTACLAEYEAGAPHGRALGDAFGFRLAPGESPWYELEARSRRDVMLRAIVRQYFGGLSARAAADALAKKIARYESGDWRRDRKFKIQPTLTGLRADLFQLLKLGAPLGHTTIRNALAKEQALFAGQGPGQHAVVAHEERYGSQSNEVESDPGSGGNPAAAAGG